MCNDLNNNLTFYWSKEGGREVDSQVNEESSILLLNPPRVRKKLPNPVQTPNSSHFLIKIKVKQSQLSTHLLLWNFIHVATSPFLPSPFTNSQFLLLHQLKFSPFKYLPFSNRNLKLFLIGEIFSSIHYRETPCLRQSSVPSMLSVLNYRTVRNRAYPFKIRIWSPRWSRNLLPPLIPRRRNTSHLIPLAKRRRPPPEPLKPGKIGPD